MAKTICRYEYWFKKCSKIGFWKSLFQANDSFSFWKKYGNVRKHRDIKLVTAEQRRNYLVSKLNYHTAKFFIENLLAIQIRKTHILMNKSLYLGLPTLDLSKTLMYEFWYDYVKLKYREKTKLCYMDTNSFIIYIKTDDIYKENTEDVETRFDISNYELERPLPKEKKKKVIGLMKDESGEKIKKLSEKCKKVRHKKN